MKQGSRKRPSQPFCSGCTQKNRNLGKIKSFDSSLIQVFEITSNVSHLPVVS